MALTFDDGPDKGLEGFLDVLEGAGARATFFVVGEQARRTPESLSEIISHGHEVGIHCYRHLDHLRLNPDEVVEDMRRAKCVIEEATEAPVRLFRPPFGFFSLSTWLEARRQGWERVLWTMDRDARDWEAGATPRSIAENVGWPEAGDIILMHDSDRYAAPDSWRRTLEALPFVLDRLSARGLQARTIEDMLGADTFSRGVS